MEVDVSCEGYEDTCCIVDDKGYIHSSYLHLYPEPFGLVYLQNGKMYSVKKVGNKFEAVKNIKKYKVIFPKACSSSKSYSTLSKQQQVQFSEILSDIREYDDEADSEKSDRKKQITKKKIGKKVQTKPRAIGVVWKHKENENEPFEKIGKEKTLSLLNTEIYSVSDLKEKAIELFSTPLNRQYFKNTDVKIHLALKDDTIITDFESNGDKQHLWQYFANKVNGHRIQINLLTVYSPLLSSTAEVKSQEHKELQLLNDVNNTEKKADQETNKTMSDKKNENEELVEDFTAEDVNFMANFIFGKGKNNPKKNSAIKDALKFLEDEKKKKKNAVTSNLSVQQRSPLKDISNEVSPKKCEHEESPLPNTLKENSDDLKFIAHENSKKTKVVAVPLISKSVTNEMHSSNGDEYPSQTKKAKYDGVISVSSDLKLTGEFKCPVTPQRRVCIDLEDVSKLPLPFMSQIPTTHLQITDKYLGAGAFGSVRLGVHNKTEVAIKVIDVLGTTPKTILKEITILKEVTHENIVSIVGVCCQYAEFWIVMGLVKGHDLRKIIYHPDVKKLYMNIYNLEEELAMKLDFSKQILRGITYIHLHHLNIIHRDIKPCNILVSTAYKQVKICDLGLAKIKEFSSILLTTKGKKVALGTQIYMAPEVLLHSEPATKASDVWSLCCTLIELFQDRHVWDTDQSYGPTHPKPLLLKQEAPVILPKVPPFIKQILISGFDYDSERRPTSHELFDQFCKI